MQCQQPMYFWLVSEWSLLYFDTWQLLLVSFSSCPTHGAEIFCFAKQHRYRLLYFSEHMRLRNLSLSARLFVLKQQVMSFE